MSSEALYTLKPKTVSKKCAAWLASAAVRRSVAPMELPGSAAGGGASRAVRWMKYPSGSRTIRTCRFPNRTGTPFGVTNEPPYSLTASMAASILRTCMRIIGTPRSKTRDSTGGLLLLPSHSKNSSTRFELDTVNVVFLNLPPGALYITSTPGTDLKSR